MSEMARSVSPGPDVEVITHLPGGPVFFASTKLSSFLPLRDDGASNKLRLGLLVALLDALHDRPQSPVRGPGLEIAEPRPYEKSTDEIIVRHDPRGRPSLSVDGREGPSISFTHTDQTTWAALGNARRLGIDAALKADFLGPYPWGRAFRSSEMDRAVGLIGGDKPLAAALLWSLKEAAVKAFGQGFHGVDPQDVVAVELRPWEGGFAGDVRVSETSGPQTVWARREPWGWLSLMAS